jgi:hypothetical protein
MVVLGESELIVTFCAGRRSNIDTIIGRCEVAVIWYDFEEIGSLSGADEDADAESNACCELDEGKEQQ